MSDRESLLDVLWIFYFIHNGDRVILCGNPALAVRVSQQRIGAQTEFSGSLARLDEGRRPQIGPIEVRFPERGKRIPGGPGR